MARCETAGLEKSEVYPIKYIEDFSSRERRDGRGSFAATERSTSSTRRYWVVWFLWFIWLVSFTKNQTDQKNQMNQINRSLLELRECTKDEELTAFPGAC